MTTDTQTRSVVLPAMETVQALRASILSAGSEQTQPILTNVQVNVAADMVTFVATDSYRLSIIRVPCVTSNPLGTWILDGGLVRKVCKATTRAAALKLSAQTITITETHYTQTVVLNGDTFVTRTVSGGTYPGWEQLVPNPQDATGDDLPAFDPTFLATLSGIATELGSNGTTPVRQTAFGPSKPGIWSLKMPSGIECDYLLMPVRVS